MQVMTGSPGSHCAGHTANCMWRHLSTSSAVFDIVYPACQTTWNQARLRMRREIGLTPHTTALLVYLERRTGVAWLSHVAAWRSGVDGLRQPGKVLQRCLVNCQSRCNSYMIHVHGAAQGPHQCPCGRTIRRERSGTLRCFLAVTRQVLAPAALDMHLMAAAAQHISCASTCAIAFRAACHAKLS